MSTRASLYYTDNVHIYQELLDEHVYVEVTKDEITINFKLMTWDEWIGVRGVMQAERIKDAIQEITDWKDKAYPLDIFPEPDLKRAHELLQAGGMVIDTVSASSIRFALKRVCEILDAALKPEQ